jgi:hypothetical protein
MANLVVQQINNELETLQKELTQFKSTVAYLNAAKATIANAKESVDAAKELLTTKAEELNKTYSSLVKFSGIIDSFIQKIDGINFPERLDKIEQGFLESVEVLQLLNSDLTKSAGVVFEQIKSIDFNAKFHDLNREVGKTVKSNQDVIQSLKDQKIPEKIDAFEKSITKFIEDSNTELTVNAKKTATETVKIIADMNIPLRLEKLDVGIGGVQSSIQNFHNRLESIERNLNDRIKEGFEKETTYLNTINEKLTAQLTTISEDNLKYSKKQKMFSYITWFLMLATIGISTFFFYKIIW